MMRCFQMAGMLRWTVQQVRSDILSFEEIIARSLLRAEEIKNLNAFISLTPELAQTQAETQKTKSLPLSGVTIAVKDNFCTKGVPTTCGSKMLKNFTPPYNATVVERLFENGAVLIGKTNLDEFGMGSGCVDSAFGKTCNAWNSNHISGGSSGGSAVAVAAGAVIAALGSDSGGSTRNPASYNGVIGLKPTYGCVSRHGLIPLVNSMDVPGILARNIADAAAVLSAISGWDPKDSTTVDRKLELDILDKPGVKDLRIGVPADYFTEHLDREVVETWKETAKIFSDYGAVVKEVRLPHTRHSIAVYSVLNQCEVASNMARYTGMFYGLRGNSDESTEQLFAESRALGLGDVVRRRVLSGNYFLLAENYDNYFVKAMQVRRLIFDDFAKIWPECDLILTPVTLSDAPSFQDFLARDSRAQSADQDFCTQPANMAGLPAMSVPIRLSSRGLPLALQLIGPAFSENLLLNVGKFLENLVEFDKLRRENF